MKLAMTNEMIQGKENLEKRPACLQPPSKIPTSTTNEPKVRFIRAPNEITTFSERQADPQLQTQPEDFVEKAFEALGESLPHTKAPNKTDSTINDDDELEIVSAVQDGSYKDALSKLFEENILDVSSDQISFKPKKNEAVAINRPKLRKRPRIVEDATYVEADMLRENVKRLRCEKASLSNRIATLLQEQSTAAIREAALMQRVADLESKLGTT
jgi:cysteinyl-tRNA synthetase